MPAEYRLGRLKGKWVVTWRDEGGKRKRYRLDGPGAADARRQAIDRVRAETIPASDVTIKQLWDAYRDEKEGRRVAKVMEYEWKAVGPHFGHLKPDQVDIATCRAYTGDRRRAGKKDGTIWTELGHLRTVLRWAAPMIIPHAPRIERPSKPAPKGQWLTLAEIDRLYAVECAPHIKLAIRLMLATAARVGAVLDLTWDRVNFETGVIDLRIDAVGPRKGRAVVPMNAGLRAALSQARDIALSDYVIEWAGGPVKSIKTGFYRAVKDAGLEGVSPHVLRHTSAVHLAVGGIPMSRIAQFLGHTSTAVTERTYARFSPEHLRQEAEILDFGSIRKVSG